MGLDINFSLKGKKIKEFKNLIDITFAALGENFFHRKNSEKKNIRPFIQLKRLIKMKSFLRKIKRIRPSNGLSQINMNLS